MMGPILPTPPPILQPTPCPVPNGNEFGNDSEKRLEGGLELFVGIPTTIAGGSFTIAYFFPSLSGGGVRPDVALLITSVGYELTANGLAKLTGGIISPPEFSDWSISP